ncbi:MAG: M4 family metallopeptidase [Phycisphaerales bacterium]|nr:MAG: M4 family metallopeptidase [Phycisphaerales bacterium]
MSGLKYQLSQAVRRKCIALVTLCLLGNFSAAGTQGQPVNDKIEVHRSQATGHATFVAAADRGIIPVALSSGQKEPRPIDFLREHGRLFGVTDPEGQLVEVKTHADTLGFTHTTYKQVHAGVPVFSGVLKVHQNSRGGVVAANGRFYQIPQLLDLTPSITGNEALELACTTLSAGDLEVEGPALTIVDPGWYGDPSTGPRLAYHFILTDRAVPLSEAFFVDAHLGEILDRWSVLQTTRNREVYDAYGSSTLPGVLVRAEGDPPVASPEDVNRAYDYLGDVYDYYDRAFGRDGIDDLGMPMSVTANYSSIDYCPNAWWDIILQRMVFCDGAVADDVVAHEVTHGITQHTARLIYQNQPGQLNESFSDVFGELVDLFNGDAAFVGPSAGPPYWPMHDTGPGTDTPNTPRTGCSSPPNYPDGVRWMVSEDALAFGGAIRDMWDPTCEGDPDRGYSLLQKCLPWDNGGVHSGSGIPNHAFAMLVDGKMFNGYTINGIGPIKAGAVWYRALTVYLTPASDFEDAYHCFNQAAQDLIGTYPNDPRTGLPSGNVFTVADALEVDTALVATEMNTSGRCGAVVGEYDSEGPEGCPLQSVFYEEDFDGGPGGWTAISTAPPVGEGWALTDNLPNLRAGVAWYHKDVRTGTPTDAAESQLYSPVITVPENADRPVLSFMQHVLTYPRGQGGNVHVSVNGEAWVRIPTCLYTHNAPHWISFDGLLCVFNEPIFSGTSEVWFTSVADLSTFASGGDTMQLMFEFGDRFYSAMGGWYIDDVRLHACACGDDSDCDNGVFCDGVGTCIDGYCETPDPCPGEVCDETSESCLPTTFFEDFENGNLQGWDLRAPGSTATEGDWLIGDPNGMFYVWHPMQAMAAADGCGCAFTGVNPSQYYNGDVDEGVVYLVSPAIDLSGQSNALLSYDWWWSVQDATRELNAAFTVDASPDDGNTWYPISVVTDEPRDGIWQTSSFRLETVIPLSDRVRIRFGAEEDTTDMSDVVEAGVDNVTVTLVDTCVADTGDADCNANGRKDWCDLQDEVSSDCNENNIPDECDIADGASADCQTNDIPDECEITPVVQTIEFPLDVDPGWSREGLWAWGWPRGHGDSAGGFDPYYGHTGDNAYGYNLEGHYENDLPERHLTTTPIDCSRMQNVHLSFWRWLWVEEPTYDHASVRVSSDGIGWTTIWENTGQVGDWPWLYQQYDISAQADAQPTVHIRWTMGPTDDNYQFCGWNIDDVVVFGDRTDGAEGDCNANEVPDDCDIADGYSWDCQPNGIPDECELDSDGDGAIDECDECPTDPNKVEPSICGCHISDTDDSDGDGVPDCVDQCPGLDDAIFAPDCQDAVPALSEWGILVTALLLLTAGKIAFTRRRQPGAA